MNKGEIILYQPDDNIRLEVRLDKDTVWLTQQQIADLFGVRQPAISKHIANIYKSGELDENSTYSILEYMGNDGKQLYTAKAYNLDMILSVGYRVNSIHATRFRQWSNAVLKKYLLEGDESVLLLLSKRDAGVATRIITRQITQGLAADLARHN